MTGRALRLSAVLVLSAVGVAAAGAAAETGGDLFPESRLITPAQGVLLNSWAKQPAEQHWKLCYTSLTMDKTPAEFHKLCDQYKPTVTVAHNSGGRPGRCKGKWKYQDGMDGDGSIFCSPIGSTCQDPAGGPPGPKCPDGGHGSGKCVGVCTLGKFPAQCSGLGSPCGPTNPGNFTFGGYADDTWSGDRVLKGTSASFIFGLGPGEPGHFGQPGQWVGGSFFPAWGGASSIPGLPNGDGLWIGGCSMWNPTGEGPPGTDGSCSHALCGGGGNWGETELEVWRQVCHAAADCGSHQSCNQTDGSCHCESGWSGVGCGTCDKKHFCSGRGSCVLPSSGDTPPCHCDAGYSGADCSTFAGSPLFPETRIISPEWGTALDIWTNTTGQVWKLCYSSDTMTKTPAEFHKRCDQYNKTVTVAHNSLGPGSSGTMGRPDSLIGRTFGGFADESWSHKSGCRWGGIYPGDTTCYKGTSACFIFGLDDQSGRSAPARYGPNECRLPPVACRNYLLAAGDAWPIWGYSSDPSLSMGNDGPPGANAAGCRAGARGGGVYQPVGGNPVDPPICGSISLDVFGETQLEVWRMATPEELATALLP